MIAADASGPTRKGRAKPFHLFAYGTLCLPAVFRAVLGLRLVKKPEEADDRTSFLAREAVLAGFKKISPDRTYLYAVPHANERIRGFVVGPLPPECLTALHRYEGRNYRQVRVKVLTADGPVRAVAFVGNMDELSHSFGWEFHDHLKQEVLLRRKIDKALREDEISRLNTTEETTRRALSELHALTIRDLIRRHFDAGGISTFAIRQAIQHEPLRDFQEALSEAGARRLAPNYLTMLVRQVMFNQIEDRIRDAFRYELDRMQVAEKFYERTISALAALRFLNAQRGLLHLLAGDVLVDLPWESHSLIDYVRWAVLTADAIYDPAGAEWEIRYIRDHMGKGYIPLGAELEFSNIGHDVIRDPAARKHHDAAYDGFLYFRDFGLDILTWKLGGHVDDHYVKSSQSRRRGFFELAFGSLSVEADISKPITDDPWLLNQIIHAAADFYDVSPHSVHISLQLRSPNRPVRDRPLPLSVMKCLFVLAGDPVRRSDGSVQVIRLCSEEIIRKKPSMQMLFSETERRRSADHDTEVPASRGRWVQQFKFLRLSPGVNYEPIIAALKGLQIHFKPGSFLTASQFESNPALRELFEELRRWGTAAKPLTQAEIEEFLDGVHEGLTRENRGRPVHGLAYIAYCLSLLRAELNAFNELVSEASAPPKPKEKSGSATP